MKVSIQTFCTAAVVLAAIMFSGEYIGETTDVSDVALANIEALADGESPCPQVLTSGYRSWSLSGFLRTKKGFRDCCGVYVEAYNPQGTCNI